jgi:rSAM/selenodomain-associated transferase 1
VKEVLAVAAKAPRAGEVKTRLRGALDPTAAAELYRCFLRDTLAAMEAAQTARPTLALALFYTPAGAEEEFAEWRRADLRMLAQRGADLGARLRHGFADLFAAGYEAAVMLGADSPTLPPEYLLAAFDALQNERTIVLGPTSDGGYYLIGLRQLHRQLFERIPWSTNRALAATQDRARGAGLEIVLLPAWYDVDTPEELARLSNELARDQSRARFTRAFLAAREPSLGTGSPEEK